MNACIKGFFIAVMLLCTGAASAQEYTFDAFVEAYNAAFQPNASVDTINKYLDFYAEDVEDVHPPYNVTMNGREKLFDGIHSYTKRMKRYHAFATKLYWSDYVAAVILYEDSEYLKSGSLKQYRGKTVLFMEFNEQGRIKHIRRHVGG
ncbi:hypothetical protein [Alteromonas facilis]|uniref:hypothetical protein n=1 Tax=Alteromonas facilis TaxID=2048004 RepID=UPI000C28B688|nr:hypothetical protein [Alteromonas facilis]